MSYGSRYDEENYMYGIEGETIYNEFQLAPRSRVATIDFEDSTYKNFEPSVSLNLPSQRLSSLTVINDGPEGIRFDVVRYDNSSQANVYVKSGEPHTIRTRGKMIRRVNFVWSGGAGSTSGANVRVIGVI
jgi:hypothetical protein